MIFTNRLLIFCMASFTAIALFGCGEKTVVAPAGTTKLEQSKTCFDPDATYGCHRASTSKVTAAVISDEWKLSRHNTSNAAGCVDCHFLDASDAQPHMDRACGKCHFGTPSATSHTGLPPNAIKNPDSYGMCGKCHTSVAGFNISIFDHITTNTLIRHFNNITSRANAAGGRAGYPASYVSLQNVNKCRNCHNPHDTSSQIQKLREWSRSGKGDIYAKPWTNYDFKTRGTTTPGASPANSFGDDCVRCHTATGFVNYITSGFKMIAPWDVFGTVYPAVSPDKTKEPLGCRACHDDGVGNVYAYKARTVGQVTAYYNYSVNSKLGITTNKIRQIIPKTYPDVKTSNMCVACHAGREIGDNIRNAAPFINFSSIGFINSHYLTAGATIFRTSGFHFYTSSSKYANKSFYLHDQIGVNNKNGTGNYGPCVTCHIGQDGEYKRHTFLPVDRAGTLVAKVCVKCHDPASNPISSAEIEEENSGFNTALAVLAKSLKNKGYPFKDSYPYFGSGFTPEKNWRKFTGGYGSGPVSSAGSIPAGALTMGAAFNLNLLVHDYGAFAHNRYYTKRLIYDAIDWIQDGVMGNGIESGVNALADDVSVFVLAKDGTVFKIDANTKARAISYLQGTRANPSGVGGARP